MSSGQAVHIFRSASGGHLSRQKAQRVQPGLPSQSSIWVKAVQGVPRWSRSYMHSRQRTQPLQGRSQGKSKEFGIDRVWKAAVKKVLIMILGKIAAWVHPKAMACAQTQWHLHPTLFLMVASPVPTPNRIVNATVSFGVSLILFHLLFNSPNCFRS